MYGKCKIYSVKERSYVQWQDRDTKRWLALLCSAAPNHQWQCRYLRDILMEGHSKQSITTVIEKLKSGNIAPGPDYTRTLVPKEPDVRTHSVCQEVA